LDFSELIWFDMGEKYGGFGRTTRGHRI
jgi:hypothetical protein